MEQFKAELEKRDFKDLPTLDDMEQLKSEIDNKELKNLSEQFKSQFEKTDLDDLPVSVLAEMGKGSNEEEGKEPKQQIKSWKRSMESLAAAGCKDSV